MHSFEQIDLIIQKLKYMTLFQKSALEKDDSEQKTRFQESMKSISDYLLSKLDISSSKHYSNEIYPLLSGYVSESDVKKIASILINQLSSSGVTAITISTVPDDPKLHYALVIDIVSQILSKLAQMKIFKTHMQKVSSDILSLGNRPIAEILTGLLNSTNELIDGSVTQDTFKFSISSKAIIQRKLELLSRLPLEDYPENLKTIVFHCTFSILIAIVQSGDVNMLDLVTTILTQCGMNFKGNQYVFPIHWSKFFLWVRSNVDYLSLKAQRHCILLIVQHTYVSSKSVLEFENHIDSLGNKLKMSSSLVPGVLFVFEFLIQVSHVFN